MDWAQVLSYEDLKVITCFLLPSGNLSHLSVNVGTHWHMCLTDNCCQFDRASLTTVVNLICSVYVSLMTVVNLIKLQICGVYISLTTVVDLICSVYVSLTTIVNLINVFEYQGRFYKQIRGISMSNRPSGTLAILCMDKFERNYIYLELKPEICV